MDEGACSRGPLFSEPTKRKQQLLLSSCLGGIGFVDLVLEETEEVREHKSLLALSQSAKIWELILKCN